MEKKEYKSYPNPIVWNANARVANFTNSGDTKIPNSGIIKAGTVYVKSDDLFLKFGKTYEASTSTTPKLLKEHSFTVGDSLKSQTITAIDTSNDDYDIITVDASITVTSGEVVKNFSSPDTAGGGVVVLETVMLPNVNSGDSYSLTVTDKCIIDSNKMPNYDNYEYLLKFVWEQINQ